MSHQIIRERKTSCKTSRVRNDLYFVEALDKGGHMKLHKHHKLLTKLLTVL